MICNLIEHFIEFFDVSWSVKIEMLNDVKEVPVETRSLIPSYAKNFKRCQKAVIFMYVKIFQRDSRSLCNSRNFNMKSVAADNNCIAD